MEPFSMENIAQQTWPKSLDLRAYLCAKFALISMCLVCLAQYRLTIWLTILLFNFQSITFNWANDVVISGLTSINSQLMHLVINSCNNVMVRNVRIVAPDLSPNTDGIHVQYSTGVTITGSSIKTGDDCISIGPGTRNLWMEKIQCGPGHGVRYLTF